MFQTLILVALGGAIGASLRHLAALGALRLFGPGFPIGTLGVNVLGSFLMGLLVVILSERGASAFSPLLLTGVLGGFTTFSAFSLDALTLWERGDPVLATLYVGASVLMSLAALAVGLFLARSLT